MSASISRAGEWLLRSGIQEPNGGVARYYLAGSGSNKPVSTEITGYAASAFVYLHTLTREARYLEAAVRAARYLARTAWNAELSAMPFEMGEPAFSYFFDCGIIVRALLGVWRATGDDEFLNAAVAVGSSMATDFPVDGAIAPILSLPSKALVPFEPLRWSASAGCYQLKAAMSWWDLAEAGASRPASGAPDFRDLYERVLTSSLKTYGEFLPGHPDSFKVVDRLHAFAYFLEGLLPRVGDPRCAAALCDGIARLSTALRQTAPTFERSDVYAQLLRIRLYADWAGAAPLDREAARREAAKLGGFQAASSDPRIDGGFYFGRKAAEWLPYVNPVSTAFAIQALALWEDAGAGAQAHRHLLI